MGPCRRPWHRTRGTGGALAAVFGYGAWEPLWSAILIAVIGPSPPQRSQPRKSAGEVPGLSPDFTFLSFFL